MKIYLNLLFTIFVMVAALSNSFSQNAIDKYFSAYEDNENFTVVTVSPKMFGMIATATKDGKNADIADLVKDIKGLKILTTEKDALKYYNEASKKIPISEYEVLMTVRDKGENVKFLTKGSGDIVDELLLLVGGGDSFVLMSFVGKLDLNKISKLANKLDIQGGEHLEKLKNKK